MQHKNCLKFTTQLFVFLLIHWKDIIKSVVSMSVSFTCEMVFITELSMNIEYMTKCNNDKCNSMVFLKI